MAEGNTVDKVDLNELLKSSQAQTLALMGNTYLNLQDYQARVFLRLESQLDPIDAFVAESVGNAGLAKYFLGVGAGANMGGQLPQPTLTK